MLSTRLHARLNRASRGRLGKRWFGAPVLVLRTVGRKSGQVRETPVLYARDGDSFVVMASAGGTRTPAWWLNLRAAGRGEAVLNGRVYPAAQAYVRMAERDFPLVVLTPAHPG